MAYSPAFIKPLLAAVVAVVGTGGVVSVIVLRSTPTIRLNSRVHGVDVGGLSQEDAAKKLRIWWESERLNKLNLTYPDAPAGAKPLPAMTPTQLGVTIDDAATIAQLPTRSAADGVKGFFHADQQTAADFPVKFKSVLVDLSPLKKELSLRAGPFKPAKVIWDGVQIVRRPESPKIELQEKKMPEAVAETINSKDNDGNLVLPLAKSEKHVSDEDLNKITELVSSYTTHFPARQYSRNNNIKVASQKLNGVVLLPGERLSFNTTVGERTVNAGFQEAGIYKNGKHDRGIGGGICQVSSTLYNASLFGNIKIVRHHNHSMPVAYVPIGRDATVNYGVIDLVIENSYPTPIAVTSEYKPGTLTFRIFGVADPALSVQIERKGIQDWDQPTQYTFDPHLQPGQQKVIEKGSRGHRVLVYRLIYKNGVLQKREPLGRSFYGASPRIIARGPAPVGGYPPPAPTPTVPKPLG